ncbi:MAG: hypothetical protein GF364_12210 [Candidatus Lokiarchaeota archaeon]|nr:hypothetical protein [Candidatus Lokiarchaeota archaeon]
MSVKSSEPTSNLDKVAIGLNITVIIVAVISVIFAIFFIKQWTLYDYYLTLAILLIISSVISVTFAILGFRFIVRTIIKHKK